MAVRTLVGRALAGKAADYSMRLSAAAALIALIALSGLSAPAQAIHPSVQPTIDLATDTDFDVRVDGFSAPGDGAVVNAGYSVSGAGDVNGDENQDFIVGAPGSTHNRRSNSGSAYVIFGEEGGLPDIVGLENIGEVGNSQGFRIDGSRGSISGEHPFGDWAGYSTAGAGDVDGDGLDDVIVGADGPNNIGAPPSVGSAYVVFGERDVIGTPEREDAATVDLANLGERGFRIEGVLLDADPFISWGDPGNLPSNWVAGAGDVNNDGIDDVIVGADGAINDRPGSGSAYVIFGGDRAGLLGGVVADVIGTPGNLPGIQIDGAIGDTYCSPIEYPEDICFGDRAGFSVSGAGDVNNDGIDDVIVGARYGDNDDAANPFDAGSAYIVFGGENLDEKVDLAELGNEGIRIIGAKGCLGPHQFCPANQLGRSVAGAGDVNGDGFDDVIVGAYEATGPGDAEGNTRDRSGEAYVIYGKETTGAETIDVDLFTNTSGFRIYGAHNKDHAGWSVAGAGDVNNDGIDDVIVGARGAGNNGRGDSGSAYVIFGDNQPVDGVFDLALIEPDAEWGFRIDGAGEQHRASWSVAGAVDVNNDGCSDMIVGSPWAQNAGQSTGSAYVVYGCEPEAEVVDSSCDGDPYNNDYAIHDFEVDTPDSHSYRAVSRLTSTFLVCGTNLGPSNEGSGTLVDHVDLLEAPFSGTSYTGDFLTDSYDAGRLAARVAYHDTDGNPKIEETTATLRIDPLSLRPLGDPFIPPEDNCNREAEEQVNPDFNRDLQILSCFKLESDPNSPVAWHGWVWGTDSIVDGRSRDFLVLGPIHLDDRPGEDAGLTMVDELTVCGYLGVVGGSSCGEGPNRKLHRNGVGYRDSNPCGKGRGIFEVSATNKDGDVTPALGDDPVDSCVEWTGGLAIGTPPKASPGLHP